MSETIMEKRKNLFFSERHLGEEQIYKKKKKYCYTRTIILAVIGKGYGSHINSNLAFSFTFASIILM